MAANDTSRDIHSVRMDLASVRPTVDEDVPAFMKSESPVPFPKLANDVQAVSPSHAEALAAVQGYADAR